jgi:hypothetical protein
MDGERILKAGLAGALWGGLGALVGALVGIVIAKVFRLSPKATATVRSICTMLGILVGIAWTNRAMFLR